MYQNYANINVSISSEAFINETLEYSGNFESYSNSYKAKSYIYSYETNNVEDKEIVLSLQCTDSPGSCSYYNAILYFAYIICLS